MPHRLRYVLEGMDTELIIRGNELLATVALTYRDAQTDERGRTVPLVFDKPLLVRMIKFMNDLLAGVQDTETLISAIEEQAREEGWGEEETTRAIQDILITIQQAHNHTT